MKLIIDGLKIFQIYLLAKDHLVESWNKICVEEPMVEDGETEDAPNKLEVIKVFRVHTRGRVDL